MKKVVIDYSFEEIGSPSITVYFFTCPFCQQQVETFSLGYKWCYHEGHIEIDPNASFDTIVEVMAPSPLTMVASRYYNEELDK